jgi:hypothetical protein
MTENPALAQDIAVMNAAWGTTQPYIRKVKK